MHLSSNLGTHMVMFLSLVNCLSSICTGQCWSQHPPPQGPTPTILSFPEINPKGLGSCFTEILQNAEDHTIFPFPRHLCEEGYLLLSTASLVIPTSILLEGLIPMTHQRKKYELNLLKNTLYIWFWLCHSA